MCCYQMSDFKTRERKGNGKEVKGARDSIGPRSIPLLFIANLRPGPIISNQPDTI